MERNKRVAAYVVVFLSVLLFFTFMYRLGMSHFEHRSVSYIHAFEVVVETFTTTGYGSHAPWKSAAMNLFVVLMQFTGILLLFTTLPLFIVPAIQGALKERVPTSVDMEDHVVICNYTSRGETIIDEFEERNVGYVVLEPDREDVSQLRGEGVNVIYGDPQEVEDLENACVSQAASAVVDYSDERNASVILSIRELSSDVKVFSLIEDADLAPYIEYAGADRVLLPRHLLGISIADIVTTSVQTHLGDTVEVGEDFLIVELPVHHESSICGEQISDSRIRDKTGVSVLGVWIDGEFYAHPGGDTVLDERTVLLVAGTENQLEDLKKLTQSEGRPHRRGDVIVAGHGEVGSTVCKKLETVPATVVDIEEVEDVDVVGDATDEDVLLEAGVKDARALVVTLGSDTQAIFTVLVARELNPNIEILVRANHNESISKLYRAGADYVLGLPNVSGRLIARNVLGEDIMTINKQIKMVRTAAPGLVESSLRDAHVAKKTGSTVVAVERNDELITQLSPDFVVEEGDTLVVAGSDESISKFESEFVD
ncbi:MAG: TrkA family potassium uptake protein [Halobacteria archaeon]